MIKDQINDPAGPEDRHFFSFHRHHEHLHSVYGSDWFALKAVAFARFPAF